MGTATDAILDRAPAHLLSAKLREKMLKIALSEHGTRPTPGSRTWGPVRKYLEAIGLAKSPGTQDYCVAFIYWCYQQAVTRLNAEEGTPVYKNPLPKQGSVPRLYTHASTSGRLVDTPQAGDIYIRGDMKHAGIVHEIPKPGSNRMNTIEGNTWIGPQDKKDWGVFKRPRISMEDCYFARY